MTNNLIQKPLIQKSLEYREWLISLKNRVRQVQLKAAVSVNSELLQFYWELGSDIIEKQKSSVWGSGFIKQLSQDLQAEFPSIKGFSEPNLRFVRRWHLFYTEPSHNSVTSCDQIKASSRALLFQIPWGHNRVIISKCESVDEALFYGSSLLSYSSSLLCGGGAQGG